VSKEGVRNCGRGELLLLSALLQVAAAEVDGADLLIDERLTLLLFDGVGIAPARRGLMRWFQLAENGACGLLRLTLPAPLILCNGCKEGAEEDEPCGDHQDQ